MGDECSCEKCQAASVYFRVAVAWQEVRPEASAEPHGHSLNDLYLIIGEGGLSLRQQSPEH
jgi:hypothetical protein